jgi:hypothetical protein
MIPRMMSRLDVSLFISIRRTKLLDGLISQILQSVVLYLFTLVCVVYLIPFLRIYGFFGVRCKVFLCGSVFHPKT